jgi:hypothetical protein
MRWPIYCVVLTALAFPTHGSNPLMGRWSPNTEEMSIIEAELRQQSLLIPEEPIHVEWGESVYVSSGQKKMTVTPFRSTVRSGQNDRLRRCLVLVSEPGRNRVAERSRTGFSDDYEPCESIRLLSAIDVNSDGVADLVYAVRMTDASGSIYPLLDVYLITSDHDVCFSVAASTRLSSRLLKGNSDATPILTSETINGDATLRGLRCTQEE